MAGFPRSRRKVAALALGLTVGALAGEAALRVLAPRSATLRYLCGVRYSGPCRSWDELRERVPVPGFVPGAPWGGFVLNSRGFRTPEFEPRPAPGVARVVVVGDSFASDCGPVPFLDHWTVQLESRLSQALRPRRCELINLGVPATGPTFHRRVLELEGLPLAPELVIWTFTCGNDVTDPDLGSLEPAPVPPPPPSLLLALLSRGGDLLRRPDLWHLAAAGVPGTWVGAPEPYDPDRPKIPAAEFLELHRGRLWLYQPKLFPEALWRPNHAALLAGAAACRARGVPLLVVAIPDESQVDPGLRLAVRGAARVPSTECVDDLPQRRLRQALATGAVECLDLLPAFAAAAPRGPRLYNLRETHWSARGNLLAAETLAPRVLALLTRAEGGPPRLSGARPPAAARPAARPR